MTKKIYVTKPSLPCLDDYSTLLGEIWDSNILTNNGAFHSRFENKLSSFLNIPNASLFVNGTLALITALKALRITGEVITTPYSFVATTHALHWNGIKPVFCDIREEDCNIDPSKIESLITPQTTAILPVHVYGNPCKCFEIQEIADVYGLKVIYDAAHAFGVEEDNESILKQGDASILSFHATKAFNTVEGGAIVVKDSKLKKRIDFLKNFGFADETTVVGYGINAKMNELIAAFGLLQIENILENIKSRKEKVLLYRSLLKGICGINLFDDIENVKHNYSYFPIFINKKSFGKSRNEIYEKLKKNNIYARRYFYPLISQFNAYKGLTSSGKENLPVATKITEEVLCLPLYAELENSDINKIVKIILS